MGQNAKFMIDSLSSPGRSWVGSVGIGDVEAEIARENNAVALAYRQLGVVHQQVSALSSQCASQQTTGADGAFSADGIKSAVQGVSELTATSGQCAENRLQSQIAAQQALATAELARTERDAMIEQQQRVFQANAYEALCQQLTVISFPMCRQFSGTPGSTAPPAGFLCGGRRFLERRSPPAAISPMPPLIRSTQLR